MTQGGFLLRIFASRKVIALALPVTLMDHESLEHAVRTFFVPNAGLCFIILFRQLTNNHDK